MLHLSDEHLIRSCMAGCKQHCSLLYERYQRFVYSLIYTKVRDQDLTADLLQETFLRAFKGLGAFRSESSFKNWLAKIAVNLCKDYWRREVRQPFKFESLDQGDESGPKWDIPDEPEKSDPSVQYERKEMVSLIARELGRMAKEDQQILLLWSEGYGQKEIAELCGFPQGTIGRKIAEGRNFLREIINQQRLFSRQGKRKHGSKK